MTDDKDATIAALRADNARLRGALEIAAIALGMAAGRARTPRYASLTFADRDAARAALSEPAP